jgi:hypothetical protein
MTITVRAGFVALAFAAMGIGAGGCYHLKVSGSQLTPSNPSSPASNPSTAPTNGPCNTTQAPGATVIPMAFAFAGTATPPPYGAINGYGPPNFVINPSQGSFTVPTPQPIQVGAGATIQFENDEGFFQNLRTVHSAAFVSATSFTPDFSFSGQQKQTGNSIGGTTVWSTGPIPASDGAGNTCFSQTFHVSASSGTVYFGDLNYYNTSNFRSVIVIK